MQVELYAKPLDCGVYWGMGKQLLANVGLVTILVAGVLCAGCQQITPEPPSPATTNHKRVAVLNALRNEINENYGFERGWPRVNRGPCGRFAKIFHEEWNSRFNDKINIVFVMLPEPTAWAAITSW